MCWTMTTSASSGGGRSIAAATTRTGAVWYDWLRGVTTTKSWATAAPAASSIASRQSARSMGGESATARAYAPAVMTYTDEQVELRRQEQAGAGSIGCRCDAHIAGVAHGWAATRSIGGETRAYAPRTGERLPPNRHWYVVAAHPERQEHSIEGGPSPCRGTFGGVRSVRWEVICCGARHTGGQKGGQDICGTKTLAAADKAHRAPLVGSEATRSGAARGRSSRCCWPCCSSSLRCVGAGRVGHAEAAKSTAYVPESLLSAATSNPNARLRRHRAGQRPLEPRRRERRRQRTQRRSRQGLRRPAQVRLDRRNLGAADRPPDTAARRPARHPLDHARRDRRPLRRTRTASPGPPQPAPTTGARPRPARPTRRSRSSTPESRAGASSARGS